QLDIGQITEGARGYIVFGHPLKINKVAQSYSTHVRSGMGGFKGRALKKYDVIATQVNHNYKTNLGKTIEISDQSDRMGYRLKGNTVAPKNSADIISEPVALGSIQVPNDGNPIILLNDKQTIGGYTKIATVTQLDLRKLAQMKPGDIIQFKWITVEEASKKLKEFNTKFEQLLKRFDEQPLFNLNQLRHTSNKIAEIIKEDR
ncbi:MAG: allophanate hydrolase, partial [Staphylococcus epidermidis]|nr:allophanate hydrolase [Staphylococcus epidermidis]